MDDYLDGYWSYWEYVPFDEYETDDWMDGWEDAEDDDIFYGIPMI